MFAQRTKIPVCTDLNKNLFKTVEILFYNFVVHVPWNKLKAQWNLHFPSNNGKTLVCDKRDRAINCEFVVNLTLMFSGLFKNDLFDGNWRLAESFFKQNLSHKVCRLLSSSVPLHNRELKQRTFFHDGGLHSVRGMGRERRLWRENF